MKPHLGQLKKKLGERKNKNAQEVIIGNLDSNNEENKAYIQKVGLDGIPFVIIIFGKLGEYAFQLKLDSLRSYASDEYAAALINAC